MCVVPIFATFVEGAVGTDEEGEGEGVALVLFGNMRHAGVDTPAVNRIIYLRAVGCDIMRCGLGDLVVETEMTPDVVMSFAELVMREEFAQRVIKCANGLLKRSGVGIKQVFVLVQTIFNGDGVLGFLVAGGVATRNQKQAEEQKGEMTDWRHKAVDLVISFAKVVKILDVGKCVEQMYMILREE